MLDPHLFFCMPEANFRFAAVAVSQSAFNLSQPCFGSGQSHLVDHYRAAITCCIRRVRAARTCRDGTTTIAAAVNPISSIATGYQLTAIADALGDSSTLASRKRDEGASESPETGHRRLPGRHRCRQETRQSRRLMRCRQAATRSVRAADAVP